MKELSGEEKIRLRNRVAQLLSEILSDQFDAEIRVILKPLDECEQDEPTEGESE